jgi:drug/metabolite transporter (DMT)-like permease
MRVIAPITAPRGFGWPDGGLLFASVMWGLNYTSVKVALRDLPPLALGFMRFLIATVLLFALLAVVERGVAVSRRDLGRLALMGALSIGANQVLFLDGLHRTTASIGAIMFACASTFTILLAVLVLGERARPRLWVGILLATAGIALIVGVGASGGGDWIGDAEVFISALTVGISSLLAKGVLRRYSALRVTTWSAFAGLCCLTPFAASALPSVHWSAVHPHAWAALLFTAIGSSVVTLMLWNFGIAKVGVTRATIYSYLQPILGVAFAAVLLGDKLSAPQVAGGCVALLGTWLASSATFVRGGKPAARQSVGSAYPARSSAEPGAPRTTPLGK